MDRLPIELIFCITEEVDILSLHNLAQTNKLNYSVCKQIYQNYIAEIITSLHKLIWYKPVTHCYVTIDSRGDQLHIYQTQALPLGFVVGKCAPLERWFLEGLVIPDVDRVFSYKLTNPSRLRREYTCMARSNEKIFSSIIRCLFKHGYIKALKDSLPVNPM